MKFTSEFQMENTCEQTIIGSVHPDAVMVTIKERGEKDCRLYFTNKDEVIALIEMLSEMHKRMEDG